ncbi:hypothetical protein PIB30_052016 [Stylosanthes scabra]|uniref:Uncharacterized protein n=1 Tax=Stylosanthes scabra TaxID=79078 RepID=A0ABU6XFT8_9FABA|nr:hypothetical protein [Stylosanthes scabra]
MADNLLTQTFYDPIDCELSGFVTRGFIKWWDAYYKQYNRSLDDIVAGVDKKTAEIKEAEKEAAKKEAAGKEKEDLRKETHKRKSESSKTTSKQAKTNPKKETRNSDLPEESNPSGMNPKSASISERTLPTESTHSASNNPSKEVSSHSKESSTSKRIKIRILTKNNSTICVRFKSISGQSSRKIQSGSGSSGYSRSPTPTVKEKTKTSNDEIHNATGPNVKKTDLLIKEKEPPQKGIQTTPLIPIQPGTNIGTQVDPRVQFQEKLKEARAESVEKVKQSIRPLPSIPIITLDADDELDDLLKIFKNLFHSRNNLENLCLKAALVKDNCDTLATAEANLKEKDALYEKHLKDANTMLNDLSTEKDILVKKLAEIQAQIQEIDNKTSKIKSPLDKIQGKKLEIQDNLSEVKESQRLNEEDLKKIQKEEDQEIEFFKTLLKKKFNSKKL